MSERQRRSFTRDFKLAAVKSTSSKAFRPRKSPVISISTSIWSTTGNGLSRPTERSKSNFHQALPSRPN